MDYQDVYYVDSNRNATPVVVDHRMGTRLPVRPTSIVSGPPPAAMAAPPYQYGAPSVYSTAQIMPNWQAAWSGYPVNPPYVSPPPATSNLASILGGFGDIGSLANIIAQAFAAFLPLPTPPTPLDNNESDSATNAAINSSNLIRYQSALAGFARRDQQILTLGSVLKELFKRPGMVMG